MPLDETERLKLVHEKRIKQLEQAHQDEMKRTTKKLNRQIINLEEQLTKYKRLYGVEKEKVDKLKTKIETHGLRRRNRDPESGELTKRSKSSKSQQRLQESSVGTTEPESVVLDTE